MTGTDGAVSGLPRRAVPAQADWLGGGGEMGRLVRAIDWSATPLGPIEAWPQSLRTTVSLCLASNFPISIAWGPEHVQIYNDGYWPICGGKHPRSMGQDFSECWASAWPAIGDAFDRALAGETSFFEDQRMFLDRNGYLEETFFTFSFSPIRDESGGVGGLFHPVTETTGKMLGQRRTRVLRDLAACTAPARSLAEAFAAVVAVMAEHPFDLPFCLLYHLDGAGGARLAGGHGLAGGSAASLALMGLDDPAAPWPLAAAVAGGQAVRVDGLGPWWGGAAVGPYPEPPATAYVLPVTPPGATRALAVLVAGVSPRLPLDDGYRGFYDLIAAAVASAVANAVAYEEERLRAEALAEIDRAKTTFFSNISHEFRTPLTLMLGPTEDALADPAVAGPDRERWTLVQRNAIRLLKLVNTLLEFSRIEAGRTQADYQPTELAGLTADLASAFRSAIERAGLRLELDCRPLPEPVHVDREMWEKIVLNLLSNALKFTFAGAITVTLGIEDGQARLRVADTGTGIPAAELPRLFERFHRVVGARSRSHEGSGIGLALVHELVKLHGGTVAVTSQMGEGTVFTVSIPLGTAHLPAPRPGAARPSSPVAIDARPYVEEAMRWSGGDGRRDEGGPPLASTSGSRPAAAQPRARILLADDNADLRDYVSGLLARDHRVQAVEDGAAALAAARADRPDLVLSDVMMPGLDGFALLRALREDASTRDVPVILLSARAGEEATLEGLAAGADDYLVKPFSAKELLARVRTHVQLAWTRRAWARELERANHELEAFSYSVSHDLRTPLRGIDGFSQALLEDHADRLDTRGRDYLQRIRAAAQRMGLLIDDMLQLSRVSRAELRRQPVDLSGLARAVVGELAKAAPRDVEVVVADGLAAEADPGLLRIVLDNLIGNAWKFTGRTPAPRIEFALGRADGMDETVFRVSDNGSGFDMAYVGNLFAPFQRLHADREFPGTGIGLATVHRIITRHGGRVWAEGAVGRGATVFFTLGGERTTTP